MSDTLEPGYCTGPNSLWANAVAMGPSGGSSETSAMMPAGWGQPGETRSATIFREASEARWLPLFIPEGCDGHKGDLDPDTGALLPEVIFYASAGVATVLDGELGTISPDNAQARYDRAVELALEAAKSTGGAGFVREIA